MKFRLEFAVLSLMVFILSPISGDDAASTLATVAAAASPIKPKENVTSEKDYDDRYGNYGNTRTTTTTTENPENTFGKDVQCYQCVGCSKVSRSDLKLCSIKGKENITFDKDNNIEYRLHIYPSCVKLILPGENGGIISRYCDYKPGDHGADNTCKITALGPLVYNTCYCLDDDGCNGSQRLDQSASFALATLVYYFLLK